MTPTADLRADLARLWDRAHRASPDGWPVVTRLTPDAASARVPDGFTAWAVGPWPINPTGTARHIIVVPTLDPASPLGVHRRLMARVVTLGTGRCPLCNEVAGLNADPEHNRAGWHLVPVTIGVRHSPGCPAVFTETDRQHFPIYREDDPS